MSVRASLSWSLLASVVVFGCAVPDGEDTGSRQDEQTSAECTASKNADGWCWGMANHPNGTGRVLAFGDADAWMANDSEVLSRWDGTAWKPVRIAGAEISALWGTSSTNVYAAGRLKAPNTGPYGVVYHFDGQTWTKVATGARSFRAIWGSGPDDIWVGGQGYSLVHFDGQTWTETAPQIDATLGLSYQAFDGTGPNDVWMATNTGDGGSPLKHWDGNAWSPVRFGETVLAIGTIRAFAPNDVWIGGNVELRHWDGATWTSIAPPGHRRFDGTGWNITSIDGRASNDVYFTLGYSNGGTGRLFHWDGATMTAVDGVPGEDAYLPTMRTVTTSSNGTLWVTRGNNAVLRKTAAGWQRTTAGPVTDLLRAASNGKFLAAVGRSGKIATYDGARWSSTEAVPPKDGHEPWLTGVATPASGVVVAAGPSQFATIAGGNVTSSQPFVSLDNFFGGPWVSALSTDDVWVSARGVIMHKVGDGWAELAPPTGARDIGQILAVSDSEVYLATELGLFAYDRGAWTKRWDTPVQVIARAPDGTLWGVQATGGIVRDGVVVPVDREITDRTRGASSIATCPNGRVYVAGAFGSVVSMTGNTWRVEDPGVWSVTALTCAADGTVWGVGSGGVVVRKP